MRNRVVHHGVVPDSGASEVTHFAPGEYMAKGPQGTTRVQVHGDVTNVETVHGPRIVHHEEGTGGSPGSRVEIHPGNYFTGGPNAHIGEAGHTYDGGAGSKVTIHKTPAKALQGTVGEPGKEYDGGAGSRVAIHKGVSAPPEGTQDGFPRGAQRAPTLRGGVVDEAPTTAEASPAHEVAPSPTDTDLPPAGPSIVVDQDDDDLDGEDE